MDEFVDVYLDENPQDEMIFEEIVDRAGLSKEERSVFWGAVGRFMNAIFVQNLNDMIKDRSTHTDIPQEVDAHIIEDS